MIFPKDEGVGDGNNGKNSNWVEHQFWKNIFKFSWAKNTKNEHFSLMQQRFSFPHNFGMEKRFGKKQFFIQAAASKQKRILIDRQEKFVKGSNSESFFLAFFCVNAELVFQKHFFQSKS